MWGSNLWPWDQESHAPLTEPARCPEDYVSIYNIYSVWKKLTRSLGICCYREGNFFSFLVTWPTAILSSDLVSNVTSSTKPSPIFLTGFNSPAYSHSTMDLCFIKLTSNTNFHLLVCLLVWCLCPLLGSQLHENRGQYMLLESLS